MRAWLLIGVFVILFQLYPISLGFAALQEVTKTSDTNMSGHDMNGMSHEMNGTGNVSHQQHGKEVANETPPNLLVLAIFGFVNLGFILYGVWNKWLHRGRITV